MPRKPEIGNIQLYPNRPLKKGDKNGYVLKFYCPILEKRIRKSCSTRDRREARRILRECRERLINGRYIESDGAITEAQELISASTRHQIANVMQPKDSEKTWNECFEHYYAHRKVRVREKSLMDAASRINIAERIIEGQREDEGLPVDGAIAEYTTLDALEYLQDRLLVGDEGLFEYRSPVTVNTMMGAVMAFVRYCYRHEWIDRVPPLSKLDADDVMKGRPITADEFKAMLEAVTEVVGKRSSESWKHVLNIMWESAFRVGDVMNFSWDDERRIHPIWPRRKSQHPTLAIPSSQKNKKTQEVPMLPGLQELLQKAPKKDRRSWIVNPLPIDYLIRSDVEWFKPTKSDLKKLVKEFNNCAIARACGVSETTIRKWLQKEEVERTQVFNRLQGKIDQSTITKVRHRAEQLLSRPARRTDHRLTKERVSRVICLIGQKANVIVQQPDEEAHRRLKFASSHDIRRGCALRLMNAGISAETLKIVMRHKDFNTTERSYGAIREAQSAAKEIYEKLAGSLISVDLTSEMGKSSVLSTDELRKLKKLLNSI